jgi:uncharacterized protein YndB with AHSA1/START domain
MTVEADGSVRHERVIDVPREEAFRLFADLDRFKPREHNMLAVPIEQTVLEPHPGGAIYDRGVDGTTCRWGRVLVFDPPDRMVFTWDIGPDWQVTSDLDRTSEVEVTFASAGEAQTRVTLVHRHIDRHGAGWESLRGGLDAADGWPVYLDRYAMLADPTGGAP